MHVASLNHFNLAVKDLEKSCAFYQQLGLHKVRRPRFPTTGIWMACEADGPPILHLNDEKEVGPIEYGACGVVHHVGFTVHGSIAGITQKLFDMDVLYDLWDPIPGVHRALYFKGPDGEAIEFVLIDHFVCVAEGE